MTERERVVVLNMVGLLLQIELDENAHLNIALNRVEEKQGEML